ncbi:dynein regulatory complex protein 12 [Ciconia maguari]
MAWQAKAGNEVLKQRLWDLEEALEQAQKDKRDVHEEMIRQYQELQKQTAAHSQRLEAKVKSLQEQVPTRLQQSQQTQETTTQALAERDRTITQLQGRLDAMEREYEKIHPPHEWGCGCGRLPLAAWFPATHHPLSHQGSLDLVLAKMAEARQHWEEVGTTIAMEHKECVQEFGLNRYSTLGTPGTGHALSCYLSVSTLGELPTSTSQHPSCPGRAA